MKRVDQNIAKLWTLNRLTLWLASLTASAQIDKRADENGVVRLNDVPSATSSKSTGVIPNSMNSTPGLSPAVSSPEAATVRGVVLRAYVLRAILR